jgi:hypothetical protein
MVCFFVIFILKDNDTFKFLIYVTVYPQRPIYFFYNRQKTCHLYIVIKSQNMSFLIVKKYLSKMFLGNFFTDILASKENLQKFKNFKMRL